VPPPRTRASGAGGAGAGGASAGAAGTGGGGADDAGAGFAWSAAAPCPLARFEANGAVVDDQLWVMGGFSSATLQVTRQVDIYDPGADSWRAGPDLPEAETHIGVVAVGSDVIVLGGFDGSFSGSRPPDLTQVWRWSAATAAWTAGPALPTARAAFAWALVGTVLHVAGGLGPDGQTDLASHVVWDLGGGSDGGWAWADAAPLANPRNHGGGATAGGLFYAIAGRHNWNEAAGDQTDVDAFDPATGAWTPRAPIPVARSEIGASTSALPDGRLLVVGGSIATVKPSADVLVYDPAADAWSALPSLPEPRKGAVAFPVGRRIVVTTGSPTSIDPSATTWVGCCL
jgi:N-acetylneuraminic acid mutarotase